MAKKNSSANRSRKTNRRGGSPAGSRELVDGPSPFLIRAAAFERQGQKREALAELESGLRREPSNIRVHMAVARAYADEFRFERMRQVHQDLINRAPHHPGVYHILGESFATLKWPEEAIASFEKAARLPGVLPETHLELAALYEQANRLEQARAHLRLAQQQGLEGPQIFLLEARLMRREGDSEGAENRLRQLVEKASTENNWTSQAWGLIALICDQREDYRKAFEAIEHCKRFQRTVAAKLSLLKAGPRENLGKMIDELSVDHFNKWRKQTDKLGSQRVAMLTGFPRSGTTLIEQVLDAHPNVVSSEERDYLGKYVFANIRAGGGERASVLQCIDGLPLNRVRYERDNYLQVMEAMLGEDLGGRLHLDKNPAYNLVIPLMMRLFPEAKLLVAIRDPRDVLVSCYLRYLPLNSVSASFLTPAATVDRYSFDMQAWLRLREILPDCWCEIRYEETVTDLERQAKRATTALGVGWDAVVLDYRKRLAATKHVNSPTYDAVAKPVYQGAVGRWKNYQPFLSSAFDKLDQIANDLGY